MAQISVEHADSASGAYATPLALSAVALTTFFLGAFKADLFSTTAIIGLVFLFGGLTQLVIGIWDHRAGNATHGAIFATHGSFWLAFGAMLQFGGHAVGNELGYFFLAWTVFAGITSLSTWRAHFTHIAAYLGFFLTFLALTIGTFATSATFNHIGGWLGIVTAVLAAYSALASMGSPFALPTGSR